MPNWRRVGVLEMNVQLYTWWYKITNDREIFGMKFKWLHVELKSESLLLCFTEVSTTSLQKKHILVSTFSNSIL